MIIGLIAAAALGAVAPAPSNCELHLLALDLGMGPQLKGNLLVRPLTSISDPLALINIMSPQDRMMDVSDADYRRVLQLAPDTLIARHWDVPVDRSVRKSAAPLISTPGKCHSELIGYYSVGMQANRSQTGKDEVLVSFVLREFSSDGTRVLVIDKGGYGAVDTVKKVGRDAALASLRAASVDIIENFGERSAKQRAKSANGAR